MLINAAKTKERMPLRELAKLALKTIFEDKTQRDVDILNNQVNNWNQLIRFQKEKVLKKYGLDPDTHFLPLGKKGSVVDEWEFFLQTICSWIVANEKGQLDKIKGLWKQHGINYKKTKRFGWLFPEQYTQEGFNRALKYLKQAQKDNPEDYE